MVIKLRDAALAQLYRGRHFQIRYCAENNVYRIKDLGVGFGTFVRVDQATPIKDGYIVMLGDSLLILNLIPDNSLACKLEGGQEGGESIRLRLKITVFSGAANGEILY